MEWSNGEVSLSVPARHRLRAAVVYSSIFLEVWGLGLGKVGFRFGLCGN